MSNRPCQSTEGPKLSNYIAVEYTDTFSGIHYLTQAVDHTWFKYYMNTRTKCDKDLTIYLQFHI